MAALKMALQPDRVLIHSAPVHNRLCKGHKKPGKSGEALASPRSVDLLNIHFFGNRHDHQHRRNFKRLIADRERENQAATDRQLAFYRNDDYGRIAEFLQARGDPVQTGDGSARNAPEPRVGPAHATIGGTGAINPLLPLTKM